MGRVINLSPGLELRNAFDGPRRVFFVGERWWEDVNRPISRRFAGQQVKIHGRWSFVLLPNVDPGLIAEIPLVSRIHRRLAAPAEPSAPQRIGGDRPLGRLEQGD